MSADPLLYGQEGVRDVDTELATGLFAARYAPERYRETAAG
jgi:hypothetical protein